MIHKMSTKQPKPLVATKQKKQAIELIKSLTAKGDHIEANRLYARHFSVS